MGALSFPTFNFRLRSTMISSMKKYHAHIYFEPEKKEMALTLSTKVLSLGYPAVKVFKIYDKKVGPHHRPMVELNFTDAERSAVLRCLELNNPDLSILVHEDSGDDYRDHLAPTWVGQPLPIDFTFFTKVAEDPALSVH